MPLAQIQVGPQPASDGSIINARGSRDGAQVVTHLHGRHYEQASRHNIFSAANQAAQAISVALATTYTGLVVSNPAGSVINLSILRFGFIPTVAPAAVASIGIIHGFINAGLTVHTTPLVPASTFVGGPRGIALADSAATLPVTPTWFNHFGLVNTTLNGHGPAIGEPDGLLLVPPGGFIAIGALTAVTGMGFMVWEEVPV